MSKTSIVIIIYIIGLIFGALVLKIWSAGYEYSQRPIGIRLDSTTFNWNIFAEKNEKN